MSSGKRIKFILGGIYDKETKISMSLIMKRAAQEETSSTVISTLLTHIRVKGVEKKDRK